MPRIHQLPPEEAQKIAAGEVIERPANVVKELIENSLDAGATRITLYIEKSGKKLIRIVDDGCGMDAQDARACFKHHATSKITSVNDLHSINTFGFRGEALSSIASVSTVTLITRPADAEHAMHLELSEGRILSEEKASAPIGTDLTIRDILFNVPVRKKFLKTDDTEWRHILHLVHAVALSRRDIHITLYHDGKQILNCPPVNDYISRAAQLWDTELAQAMINCSGEERGIRIEGMISDYTAYRYDRNALYFFVNGRWIKNYTLSRALMKGYANAIPAAQFPTASLMITIDPAQIDVNIHPRKEEVQFLHPRIVDDLVQMAVKAALEARLSTQLKSRVQLNSTPTHSQTFTPRPAMPTFVRETASVPRTSSYTPYNFDATDEEGFPTLRHISTLRPAQGEREMKVPFGSSSDSMSNDEPAPLQSATETQEQKLSLPFVPSIFSVNEMSAKTLRHISIDNDRNTQGERVDEQIVAVSKSQDHHTVLGVYDKTYIMLSTDEGILFIDQHAAHERILYEQFKTRFADTATITLMFPHALTFKREILDTLEPYLSVLSENGIHIKRSSETELIITATPVYLKNASFKDMIQEMISYVSEQAASPEIIKKQLTEKVHAQMACSAAVKASDELSPEHIQKLLTDLANTDNRFTCPHGRPTSWLLNHDEIVKKFQRDYLSKKPSKTNVM